MQISIVLLLLLSAPIQALELAAARHTCEFLTGDVIPGSILRFSDFVRMNDGAEIYVRVDEPKEPPKGWFYLKHGLMETHFSFNRIAEGLIKQGYGVIRGDSRGFGRSLVNEIERLESTTWLYSLDVSTPLSRYVDDDKTTLRFLKNSLHIERPRLVGHSAGAALVMSLLSDAEGRGLVTPKATLLAPYIYRLDYYNAEKILYFGFTPPVFLTTVAKYVPRAVLHNTEQFFDRFLADPGLKMAFKDYFDTVILNRELRVPAGSLSRVRRRHVDRGIAFVKTLREFNAWDTLEGLPPEVGLDLIYGDLDKLVVPEFAERLGYTLVKRGGQSVAVHADHDVLNKATNDVVNHLTGGVVTAPSAPLN